MRKTISALGLLGGGEMSGDIIPHAAAVRTMISKTGLKGSCGDEVMIELSRAVDDTRVCADPPAVGKLATPAAALLRALHDATVAGIAHLGGDHIAR